MAAPLSHHKCDTSTSNIHDNDTCVCMIMIDAAIICGRVSISECYISVYQGYVYVMCTRGGRLCVGVLYIYSMCISVLRRVALRIRVPVLVSRNSKVCIMCTMALRADRTLLPASYYRAGVYCCRPGTLSL